MDIVDIMDLVVDQGGYCGLSGRSRWILWTWWWIKVYIVDLVVDQGGYCGLSGGSRWILWT